MSELITICLTKEQQEQPEQIRDTDKRPYMRERAAAMLKIAEGITPRQVALKGLLKSRKPDTVYDWVKRYQQEGVAEIRGFITRLICECSLACNSIFFQWIAFCNFRECPMPQKTKQHNSTAVAAL